MTDGQEIPDEYPKRSACILLNMYGDGKKFTTPCWYSCGKCNPCRRQQAEDPGMRRFSHGH